MWGTSLSVAEHDLGMRFTGICSMCAQKIEPVQYRHVPVEQNRIWHQEGARGQSLHHRPLRMFESAYQNALGDFSNDGGIINNQNCLISSLPKAHPHAASSTRKIKNHRRIQHRNKFTLMHIQRINQCVSAAQWAGTAISLCGSRCTTRPHHRQHKCKIVVAPAHAHEQGANRTEVSNPRGDNLLYTNTVKMTPR